MPATKTHPARTINVTTFMVGLKYGYIRKGLTKNIAGNAGKSNVSKLEICTTDQSDGCPFNMCRCLQHRFYFCL